jgi:hypothetical protein
MINYNVLAISVSVIGLSLASIINSVNIYSVNKNLSLLEKQQKIIFLKEPK